ncbi:hypothetical protein F398_gp18 [Clostridium phage phi24R]|uniref:Uncharacterized protein n=1 Tax=Clostridium phage phi24R TaxID=1128071 RepID=G9J3I5_9CAUD|nr:hypothetical protein F398_gp18 [Clostridium phage phi24R]AEW47850.1 hypothetical protein phi24R_gp18 [Clostridium phage phi24R]
MIIIDRNKITVNQFDLCILDLKLCEYNLKVGDKIEINIDGEITVQDYNNLDIQFNTDNKGVFDYSITIIQQGFARTKVIQNKIEVV